MQQTRTKRVQDKTRLGGEGDLLGIEKENEILLNGIYTN